MTSTDLKMLFSMNHSLLTRNLEGVTTSVAMSRPGPGNAIAWSLGHVVYWRQTILGLVGASPVWGQGEAECFKGTSREVPATIDRPWDELCAAYHESHRRLMEAFAVTTELPEEVARRVAQLQCHETYHVGQVAMARRVSGLPGAI